ncbi:esterase/lipase family protein [Cytobacillus sp. IB215665]|uniref:esterase/lipase family protein n=1 Tax=Cytobacillus sp. IB215665 TaxID=3097357 RepID=UPI002A112619|nr:proprotein convertase P-domain-containing protein [Cytobacillus sp. IB215665]MDX8365733.1 proprotein convertase P-domain-containing protein [Cytobacillus sp. IB215665]
MKIRTYLLIVLLTVMLVFPPSIVKGAIVTDAIPKPINVTDTPGTWYLGALPDNVNMNKSPLVFVQGLHGNAKDWWEETVYYGENDMYNYAYANGYRTAFVQLEDATGGDAADMWHNGQMLASMLEEIYDYFGEQVTIIAHSKGGVDTQTALVHFEAWPYVNDVITLSSPHYGSPLADLAYSSWANWLADLIGRTDEGTFVMQTGEMEKFRLITDENESAYNNNYYTASGTGWGPLFSALWFGGAYLGGDNDGLVPVWSSRLPYGTHFFSGGDDIDHDNIRMGNSSFDRIATLLNDTSTHTSANWFTAASSDSQYVPEQLLRGGSLSTNHLVEELIPVESDNNRVVFQILTASEDVNVKLISPKGKEYTKKSKQYIQSEGENYFKNTYIQTFTIDQPGAGEWQIDLNSSNEDAYFIVTNFQGSNALNIDWGELEKEAKDKNKDKKGKKLKIDKKVKKNKSKQKIPGDISNEILDIIQADTYNVTYEIVGTTESGETFYRTAVKSYYQYDEN